MLESKLQAFISHTTSTTNTLCFASGSTLLREESFWIGLGTQSLLLPVLIDGFKQPRKVICPLCQRPRLVFRGAIIHSDVTRIRLTIHSRAAIKHAGLFHAEGLLMVVAAGL